MNRTGPGELSLTATAANKSNGDSTISASVASKRSLARFSTAAKPAHGDSQTAITGTPATDETLAWIGSNADTSATKYTEAVVSRRSSSSASTRGCVHNGSAL